MVIVMQLNAKKHSAKSKTYEILKKGFYLKPFLILRLAFGMLERY